MFILDQQEKTVHDSHFIQRFVITPKDGEYLINACLDYGTPTIKIGVYDTESEAKEVLLDLFLSLYGEASCFVMPPREHDKTVKDARIRRKGGS